MPVGTRLPRQATRWHTLRKQVRREAGSSQTDTCTQSGVLSTLHTTSLKQQDHNKLQLFSSVVVFNTTHAQAAHFHAFNI